MTQIPEEGSRANTALLLKWSERATALCVIAAATLVPLVFSSETRYALDIKRPIAEACALLAGLALLVGWASGGRPTRPTATMTRVLGLFLCAVTLSLAFCQYQEIGLRETWRYAAHVILFLAAAVVGRSRGRAVALVTAILITATLVAMSGCLQAFGVDVFGPDWSKGGRTIPLGRGARVMGTIGLETALGGYMATCAILAIGVLFCVRQVGLRVVVGSAALLMAACMVFSGTRTAWLAFMVGLLVLVANSDWAKRKQAFRTRTGAAAVVTAALLICLTAAFWPSVSRRLAGLPKHLRTRTTIWRSALSMFYQSPVVGVGPGAFQIYFPDHRPHDYADHAVHAVTLRAHSEYLEVLAETGMVGMVPFALFLGLFFIGTVRALRRQDDAPGRPLLLAAFAAGTTMLVHAVASVDTRYPTCQMLLWVMMGLTVALWENEEPAAEPVCRPTAAWRMFVVLAAVMVALLIWTTEVYRPHLARVHLRRANDLQKAGDWAGSAESAARAIELDSVSIPSYYTLANSLFYAGEYEAALDAFRKLQVHSPNHACVHARVAALNALLGRMGKAREALRLALRYGVLPAPFAAPDTLTDDQLRELAAEFEKTDRTR